MELTKDNVNNLIIKTSGLLLTVVGIFSLYTAYKAPSSSAGSKIAFAVVGILITLWGLGSLQTEAMTNIGYSMLSDAYPGPDGWPANQDSNNQVIEKDMSGPVMPYDRHDRLFSLGSSGTLTGAPISSANVPDVGGPAQ